MPKKRGLFATRRQFAAGKLDESFATVSQIRFDHEFVVEKEKH